MVLGVFEGWFTRQLLFDGLINGMVFGLVAMSVGMSLRTSG